MLKELCTNKRKFKENKIVALSEKVSAVLQRKLSPKLKDPGSFTILCTIGAYRFEKAVLDVAASINLMPYFVYEALDLGKLKETNVRIELVDRSLTYLRGWIEDVLVNVNGLILLANFFALDMDDAPMPTSLPLILGRPFMATAHTKIDVFQGTLTMEVLGENVGFNIFEAMRCPTYDSSQGIGFVETNDIVQDNFSEDFGDDPSTKEPILDEKGVVTSTEPSIIATVVVLNALPPDKGKHVLSFELLSCSNIGHTSSLDKFTPVRDAILPTPCNKRLPPIKLLYAGIQSDSPKQWTSSYDPTNPPDPNKNSFLKKMWRLMCSYSKKDCGMITLI